MPFITTPDSTQIYYQDIQPSPPSSSTSSSSSSSSSTSSPRGTILFSHGWPLDHTFWDSQLFHLASHGYRVLAHDRRSHGQSSQTWQGNTMDTYASDLSFLIEKLNLRDLVLVGHSTGGGEVTRYASRYGIPQGRVRGLVLIGAVPPLMVKTEGNPEGLDISVFDSFRESSVRDRGQFYYEVLSGPFAGFNRPQNKKSEGLIQGWMKAALSSGFKGAHDCIAAFSETDFTQDLKEIGVAETPVLLLHGDDDQIVPIEGASRKAVKLLKKDRGELKVYPGGSHALPAVNAEEVNEDILAFLTGTVFKK